MKSNASREMPMPVSRTSSVQRASSRGAALIVTVPLAVNLTALLMRFANTCANMRRSVKTRGNSRAQLDVLISRRAPVMLNHFVDHLADVQLFKLQSDAAGFEARIVEQVVDEIKQRTRVAFHARDRLLLQGRKRQLLIAPEQLR